MINFLNFLIVFLLIITFFILIAGLFHGAKFGQKKDNKINAFMRYRVLAQFFALVVLSLAIFLKDKL